MSELRSCPFCGGEAELHDGVVIIPVIDENGAYIDADVEDTPAWVECAACGAATDGVDSADEAIAAWNRRTEQESELPASSTPTNAQRIRSMSDEELAEIIASEPIAEKIPFCKSKPECYAMLDAGLEIPESMCAACALDWLKAETEGTE